MQERNANPKTVLILNGSDGAGTTISADVYSDVIYNPPPLIQMNYEFNTSGTGSEDLVAVLKLQVWDGDDIGWVTDSLGTFPEHPAGSLVTNTVTFTDVGGRAYRVWVDVTSGDGLGLIELVR